MCRMNRSIWQLYSREANATKDTRPQFSMPILPSEIFIENIVGNITVSAA